MITGKKLNMSQVYKDDKVVPVTSIKYESAIEKDQWPVGQFLKVSGTSKGRGFQGGVKRHGFKGGPKTHGQKNRHRAPGSIGDTSKQRVVPGRRMAGHMGNVRVTVKNLELIAIDEAKKILMVKGAVPGHRNSVIEIRK